MADISKIELPSGITYSIKDEVARNVNVSATYTSSIKDLELTIVSAANVDNTEY